MLDLLTICPWRDHGSDRNVSGTLVTDLFFCHSVLIGTSSSGFIQELSLCLVSVKVGQLLAFHFFSSVLLAISTYFNIRQLAIPLLMWFGAVWGLTQNKYWLSKHFLGLAYCQCHWTWGLHDLCELDSNFWNVTIIYSTNTHYNWSL